DASFQSFPKNNPAPANYLDWIKRNRSFSEIAAIRYSAGNLTEDGMPEFVIGSGVTPNFFSIMGVKPAIGRVFTEDEAKAGATLGLLSDGLWQRRYGGDPGVVGRTIRMDGRQLTVLGIMPKAFNFPDKRTDYWRPIGLTDQEKARRGSHYLRSVARLKPGV